MFAFYLVNALFFILLATRCCWMSEEKRHRVCRNVEQLFGIQERPLVTNTRQMTEEEVDEFFKQEDVNPDNSVENNINPDDSNKENMDFENDEKAREEICEITKKVLEDIHNELEKKEK